MMPPLPTRRRRAAAPPLRFPIPQLPEVEPEPAPAGPANHRLADRTGQVWEHPDWHVLSDEVARLNRRMRPTFPPYGAGGICPDGLCPTGIRPR